MRPSWRGRRHDPAFRLADIPLDDRATAALIERAETIGVFQCESDGAQRTLRKLRARTVADLAIANAFFKPGPAMGGMAAAFVRRYRGEEAVAYLHPALKPILGPTKGVLIFQEQILRLAREIAGLTWAQADQIAPRYEPLRRRPDDGDPGAVRAGLPPAAARGSRLQPDPGEHPLGTGDAVRRLRLQPGARDGLR